MVKKIIKPENKIKKFLKTFVLLLFHKIENNTIKFSKGEENAITSAIQWAYNKNGNFSFIDVGANRGDYTGFIVDYCEKKSIPYVGYLFEPVIEIFEFLIKKFKSNSNLIINNCALSDRETEAEIYLGGPHSSIERFEMLGAYNSNKYEKKQIIKLKKLDSVIVDLKIDRCDYLKIDTEGHEMSVMQGAQEAIDKKMFSFIQYEYGDGHIFSRTFCRDFYNYFEKNNYKVFKLRKKYFEKQDYNFYLENFKTCNYIAINKDILNLEKGTIIGYDH